jgi:hypothetical protein
MVGFGGFSPWLVGPMGRQYKMVAATYDKPVHLLVEMGRDQSPTIPFKGTRKGSTTFQ